MINTGKKERAYRKEVARVRDRVLDPNSAVPDIQRCDAAILIKEIDRLMSEVNRLTREKELFVQEIDRLNGRLPPKVDPMTGSGKVWIGDKKMPSPRFSQEGREFEGEVQWP